MDPSGVLGLLRWLPRGCDTANSHLRPWSDECWELVIVSRCIYALVAVELVVLVEFTLPADRSGRAGDKSTNLGNGNKAGQGRAGRRAAVLTSQQTPVLQAGDEVASGTHWHSMGG